MKTGTETRRLGTTVGDQVASSASNALVIFAVARVASVAEFGITSVYLLVLAAVMATCRGLLGVPLSRTVDPSVRAREASFAVPSALIVAVAGAAVLLGYAAVGGHLALAVPVAIALPFVLVQDVLRYNAIAAGRPGAALVSDGAWAAGAATILVYTFARPSLHPLTVLIAWALLAVLALGLLGLSCPVRPSTAGIREWWSGSAAERCHYGADALIGAWASVLVMAYLTLTLGDTAVAGLRGAGTLLGPISVLVSAITLALVPHLIRRATSGYEDIPMQVRGAAAMASGLPLAIAVSALLLPASAGQQLLGASWAATRSIVWITGIEYAAIVWIAFIKAELIVQGNSGTVLRGRLMQTVVAATGALLVGATGADVRWVAASLCAGAVAAALFYRHHGRGERS